MVKNECVKLFRNRVFLVCFAAMFVFYGFYLYWSLVLYVKEGIVERAPASYYQALTDELSSFKDEERWELLAERYGQMEEFKDVITAASKFSMTMLAYEEVWDEVDRAVHYQEILSTVLDNTDKRLRRLDKGNYGALERRYLESRLQKTKEVYGRLTDIAPEYCPARGIQALVDNPVTDLCCLFIVLLAMFQLVTVERQNELIILSKTTVRGRRDHGFVKAAVLGGLCILVSLLLLAEGIFVIGRIYPFPPLRLPIQSVYSYCAMKINIGEFLCLYVLLKILFYWLCAAMCYFVCCLLRKVIPIFLVIFTGGSVLIFLYLGISETSYFAPLRDLSPIALGQAGDLLERYQCVNLFGYAVNRLSFTAILLCGGTLLFLAASVGVYAVSKEKSVLTARHSVYGRRKRWSVSLTAHECYKAFVSQKLIFVLAAAAIVSCLLGTRGGMETSFEDHLYYAYSTYVAGEYTEEIAEHIRQRQDEVIASASRPGVQDKEKVLYDIMLETYSKMAEYAEYLSGRENSYYINNPDYITLTGGNESANRRNIVTFMLMYGFAAVCFVLTISIDYQRGENGLILSTVKGRRYYIRAKVFVGMLISLILLILYWAPETYRLLRINGVAYIFTPAYNLRHLSWVWGGISIFTYICLLHAARYVSLLVLMAFSYFVERKVKSSVVAVVCACAVAEFPLAILLLSGVS